MELAALPRDARQHGTAGRLEAGIIVGDDQLHFLEAAPNKTIEEGAPMHLGFEQAHRHIEHATLAIQGHTDSDQNGAIHQLTAFAHPVVTGVEEQVGWLLPCLRNWALTRQHSPLYSAWGN
jgi:hypothetical protein